MTYPILTSYLSDEQKEWKDKTRPSERDILAARVDKFEAAFAAGTILNVDYKDARDIFNWALDRAVKAVRERYYWPNKELLGDFDSKVDTICLYLNLVPGRLKKAEAYIKGHTEVHPYIAALLALLNEIVPLAEQVAFFQKNKDKIVKRLPKPIEDRAEGYTPPAVTTEAQRRVLAVLESVTARAYDELMASMIRRFNACLATFLKAAETGDKEFSPYMFFIDGRKIPNHAAYFMVNHVVRENGGAWVVDDGAQAYFEKTAKLGADDIRRNFVHKNFRKIASIVDAKGNLDNAEAIEHTVSLDGLEGTFVFSFDDGSRFTVVNSVVGAYSIHGNFFLRFPLTFHSVCLPGGTKKMDRPSEKRMNDIFAKE